MIRNIVYIKLTQEFKQEAIKLICDTIEKVSSKSEIEIDQKEKNKIKNLSLDQINIDIAHKNKLKAMWVFDTEDYIPILLFVDRRLESTYLNENLNDKVFVMETNGDWKVMKGVKDGVNKAEFEKTVLQMLLEDFETASFYGTLSHVRGGFYG